MNIIINDIIFFIFGFAAGYAFCIWWISPDLHKLRKRVAQLEHEKRKKYDTLIETAKTRGIEIDPDA